MNKERNKITTKKHGKKNKLSLISFGGEKLKIDMSQVTLPRIFFLQKPKGVSFYLIRKVNKDYEKRVPKSDF